VDPGTVLTQQTATAEVARRGGRVSRLASVGGGLAFLLVAGLLAVRYYQPWKHTGGRAQGPEQASAPIKSPAAVADPQSASVTDPDPTAKREDVGALLEWARRTVDGNRLVKPPGDNLKDLLGRINAADPGNADAAALKTRVVQTVKARALGELRKKNLEAAEGDLRALLELAPEEPGLKSRLAGTLAMRARMSLMKNRYTSAIADASAAVELLPEDPSVRMVLGDAYFQVGKADQAIDEYKKVLALQPTNKRAQKRLATAVAAKPAVKKKKKSR
jgi:hypothetical protein